MLNDIAISETQWEKLQAHTLSVYPQEMCGFLTETDFLPMENKSSTPETSFLIDPVDFVKHRNSIVAICHSHGRNPRIPEVFDLRTPSIVDYESQKLGSLPWLIFGTEGMSVSAPVKLPRVPSKEYHKRPFVWLIHDCYTLVQDFYRFELNINLRDYIVTESYEQLRAGHNIFDKFIEDYGFKEVPLKEIQKGDLVLLDHKGFKRNHLGIYVNNSILHQDVLSVEVPFSTFVGRINCVLRYEN